MFSFTPFRRNPFPKRRCRRPRPPRLRLRHGRPPRPGLWHLQRCPWARRYGGISGDLVEYNTGVLFFTKKAQPIFDAWNSLVRTVDSSIRFFNNQKQLVTMPYNDQAAFSLAVAQAPTPPFPTPFILPFNWNFRRPWHRRTGGGPIKIWHDYSAPPQAALIDWTKAQAKCDAVIQYTAFNG